MHVLKMARLTICWFLVSTCVLVTLNEASPENCSLYRQTRDILRHRMNGKNLCEFTKKECSQRNAKFYKNNSRLFCGCRCLVGFNTYSIAKNFCVENKETLEGCRIYSASRSGRKLKMQAVGLLPTRRKACLKLNLTTANASCSIDRNTSRFLKDSEWMKFKEDAFPLTLETRKENQLASGNAKSTVLLYFLKWQFGKRRDPRKKVIMSLKGNLVKVGLVCGGVYKCTTFKVPGKQLPCGATLKTTSPSLTTIKATTLPYVASERMSAINSTRSSPVTISTTEQIVSTTEQIASTEKSTVKGVVDGVDSGHRKDDNSHSLSITVTVAATTATMVFVLFTGILLVYFCRIKRRKGRDERRPSRETLEGVKINNLGTLSVEYGRNRTISEAEDVSSVYSEISNLTDVSRKPPAFYNVIEGSIRHTKDKLPLPPPPTTAKDKPDVNKFVPALPPTPDYIGRSLMFPINKHRNLTAADEQPSSDKLKGGNTVSKTDQITQVTNVVPLERAPTKSNETGPTNGKDYQDLLPRPWPSLESNYEPLRRTSKRNDGKEETLPHQTESSTIDEEYYEHIELRIHDAEQPAHLKEKHKYQNCNNGYDNV